MRKTARPFEIAATRHHKGGEAKSDRKVFY